MTHNFGGTAKEKSSKKLNFKAAGLKRMVTGINPTTRDEEKRVLYEIVSSHLACRTDKEFYDALAEAVLKQTSSNFDELMENAKLFLSRISPKFTIGADPMTDFSMS